MPRSHVSFDSNAAALVNEPTVFSLSYKTEKKKKHVSTGLVDASLRIIGNDARQKDKCIIVAAGLFEV